VHIHHIIPTHVTGGVANNHPDNLIALSVEEHAEMHKQRWLMERDWQDEIAWLTLTKQITLEEANRLSARNGNLNIPKTESAKKAMAKAQTGRIHSEASKQKRREASLRLKLKPPVPSGPRSPEIKAKISSTLKGRVPWNKGLVKE